MLSPFAYQRAANLKDALAAASRPDAKVLAGGTDLLGCLRDGIVHADRVVSVSAIKELKGIAATPSGGLRIGALTTLTEIAADRRVRQAFPVLAEAAASVGSPQLRNQGTLGGNLCQRPRCWYFRGDFPCLRKGGKTCFAMTGENQYHAILGGDQCYMVHPSDTASALVALDAKLRIAGPKGVRTVPAASFFILPKTSVVKENVLEPGELVTEILLDPPATGARSTYRKVRERGAFDFALVGAAIVLVLADGKVRDARVVLSGVAPAPWRSTDAEKALIGKELEAGTVSAAAVAAVKDAVPLGDNEYKVALVRGTLEETLTVLGR